MAFTIQCGGCGENISGKNEADAEAKWDDHVCESTESLDLLPVNLLRKAAYGKTIETEAMAKAKQRAMVLSNELGEMIEHAGSEEAGQQAWLEAHPMPRYSND